jgi:hypothetical protein
MLYWYLQLQQHIHPPDKFVKEHLFNFVSLDTNIFAKDHYTAPPESIYIPIP